MKEIEIFDKKGGLLGVVKINFGSKEILTICSDVITIEDKAVRNGTEKVNAGLHGDIWSFRRI